MSLRDAYTLPDDPVLPSDVAREIDNFESETERFLRGELAPERYKAFRLAHGVYGQRQPGVQMVRVKIPGGDLTARQVVRLASIAREFTPDGVLHLTTRQDVQFHFVPLDRVVRLLRLLADAGLTTREACGNSVRNVTACPVSGFIADEWFDVQPYARATYAFLVRNAFCQQLARKFKIAFSSCPEDCAAAAIHDIGLLGRLDEVAGRTRYGFRVLVGGGLGATPFTAEELSPFVPAEDLLRIVRAILMVFADHGNRRNRMKARMKFIVRRHGIDSFRDLVGEAVAGLTPGEIAETELFRYVPERYGEVVRGQLGGCPSMQDVISARSLAAGRAAIWSDDGPALESGDDIGFLRWQAASVRPHRDACRAVVTVQVPLGDLNAAKMQALGLLVDAVADDHARISISQNLVLPSVRRERLRELHAGLVAAGLSEPSAGTALDVTSCPGTDTCALGITSSKGLARAIRRKLGAIATIGTGGIAQALDGIAIKISGCPNACGQHHVAGIGFHGVVRNEAERKVPAYQLHWGGSGSAVSVGEKGLGAERIGRPLLKIPAREVPAATAVLVDEFARNRLDGESFDEFAARWPVERIEEVIRPFAQRGANGNGPVSDWDRDEPFSTDDMGRGECAGAGADASPGAFDNASAELQQARLFLDRRQWADALANYNRAQYTLARVLLEAVGRHPESDYECACELRARVIDRGLAGEGWNEIHATIAGLLRPRTPNPGSLHELDGRFTTLLEEFRQILPRLARRRGRMGRPGASAEIPG